MKKNKTKKASKATNLDFKHNRLLQIASIVFILMLVAFVYNKILPWQIEAVVIVTVVAGLLLVGFNRLPKSLQITGVILMMIGTLGLFYSQNLLNRAFNQLTVEKSVISFVVKKESTIETLEADSSLRFAYSDMLNQELKDHVVDEVDNEFELSIAPTNYSFDNDAYAALLANETDVLIIDNALVPLLEEEYASFSNDVRVIHTVSKTYDRETIKTETNFKKDPFIVYISGLDVEGPLTNRSRSDVNILVFVNPNKGEILQVTIPRDYYIPIACQNDRKDKLTHAGIYGVDCSIKTIENYMDIQIDLYARVNFTSFMNIINVVGDIEVYSEYSFYTSSPRFLVQKGMNTFNAEQALAFSRARKQLPGGDVTRGLNQQEVVKGVINKLISPSQIFNLEGIIRQTSKSVDTNATSDDLLDIVNRQIKESIKWEFSSMSMQGTNSMLPGVQNPNQMIYYMQPNPEVEAKVQAAIKDIMSN